MDGPAQPQTLRYAQGDKKGLPEVGEVGNEWNHSPKAQASSLLWIG